ncbi:MAG: toll/interleukin-1 receptor domain-containing protein [Gaiellaceae bacterium]
MVDVVEPEQEPQEQPAEMSARAEARADEVFVSYSRKDIEFVRWLDAALSAHGIDAYVDWEIHSWSPDWQEELYDAIEGADTFLYVLSENSLASEHVRLELDHAVGHGKRIKPIQIGDVEDDAVPEALKKPQWTDFRNPDRLDGALADLLEALNTDADWVQMHTSVLVDAIEWEENDEDKSFLLGRTALASAEAWLTNQAGKEPPPTDLQMRYVSASRTAAARRRQKALGAVLLALVVAVGLAVFALLQRSDAISQKERAEREAKIAESRELAAVAKTRLSLDPEQSLLLASEAAGRAQTQEARDALEQALLSSRVRRSVEAGAGPVASVAFSPDGELLLTADRNAARLWEVESGRPTGVFPGHESPVNGAAFDEQGEHVAVARDEGGIEIWSVAREEVVGRLQGDSLGDNAVRFATREGRSWLLSAGLSGTTHIYDVAEQRRIAAFKLDANAQSVSLSPDGERVVVAYVEGPTRVWDVASERQVLSLPSQGAWTAAYSSDGQWIVTGDADDARIWDAETGELVRELTGSSSIGIISAAFSPDDTKVATGGTNGDLRIWDAGSGRELAVLGGHSDQATTVAFNEDGTHVASGSDDGSARVWEVDNGQTFTQIGGGTEAFQSFSWTGKYALTGGPGGTVSVWPVEKNTRPTKLPVSPAERAWFSTNDERLLVETATGIELWRVGSWTRAGALPPESLDLTSAALSPDNRFLVTANQGRVATVWNISRGEVVRELTCKDGGVWSVTFSPDRDMLAVICLSETVVWDTSGGSPSSWAPVEHFPSGTDPFFTGVFSLDSEFLLLQQTNGTMHVVRAEGWREASTFVMPPLGAHTFSEINDLVVTTDDAGRVGAWDLADGRTVPLFGDVRERVADVVFAPDERAVLAALENGVVRRFACDICSSFDDLLALAGERVTRPLSPDERRLFLHEP